MGNGQAWCALWAVLSIGAGVGSAKADEVPLPRDKPIVGETQQSESEDSVVPRTGPPTTGGRTSGATFYEANGAVPVTWDPDAIGKARLFCQSALQGLDLDYKSVAPIGGPEGCGAAAPIEVRAVAGVEIRPPATLVIDFT